jgi:hypothetical protein
MCHMTCPSHSSSFDQLNTSSLWNFLPSPVTSGAWGSIVVKALRYWSEGLGIDPQWCRWGFFSEATDGTMCPRVDSASKNEYRELPGGKDGRCVRVTTLPPSWCRKSRRSGSLNLLESEEPLQACSGKPLPFTLVTSSLLGPNTRWFKYDWDWLCVNKSQFVPVICEPPCTILNTLFSNTVSLRYSPWYDRPSFTPIQFCIFQSLYSQITMRKIKGYSPAFFSGAFAKLRKETNSVMPVRPSVRLPLDVFWWNLILDFSFFRKSVQKIQVSLKSDENNVYFTWRCFHIYYSLSLNYS